MVVKTFEHNEICVKPEHVIEKIFKYNNNGLLFYFQTTYLNTIMNNISLV